MGINIIGSSCSCRYGHDSNITPIQLPQRSTDIDPTNYSIKKIIIVEKSYVIVDIKYHDCTNYEGRKILLYDYDEWTKKYKSNSVLDPHFCDDKKCLSPIARFEPTARGLKMAKLLAKMLP